MTLIKAVIVSPDGNVWDYEIEHSLESFQSIVGGYIEAVFSDEATIYVNEEGLITGLPMNPLATRFAQRILGAGTVLVGTALILGPPDSEGNDTPVRQSVVDYLTKEN